MKWQLRDATPAEKMTQEFFFNAFSAILQSHIVFVGHVMDEEQKNFVCSGSK